MLKLNKLYRKFYSGENVVVERNYTNGVWHDTTEFVPNAVTNTQISNQAVILGNGPSRLDFNLNYIKNHRGGLLANRALQSYGCNALYRDFTPDFLIARGNSIIKEIADSGYTDDNIVYTDAIHTLEYPNKFYLTPHDPYADAGTTAAYIAAFDGHKNIYLLGFDGQDTPGHNYNVYAGTAGYEAVTGEARTYAWRQNFRQLAQVYNDVMFSFVFKESTRLMPTEFRDLLNVEIINYNKFALAVDL
jgi:hypothetical protein